MARALLVSGIHSQEFVADESEQMENDFYRQAREWGERYGYLALGKRNWQVASAGSMPLSLILALGIVWASGKTKAIPYVVEVDKLGYALTIPVALNASTTPTSSG